MVFPAPVWPTMATVWPGSMVKETSFRIHSMSLSAASSARLAAAWSAAPLDRRLLLRRQLLIGKPDVAEFDAVGAVARARMRGAHNFRLGIEQLEDALAGGHGGLQDVVLVAQVLNGPPEALRVHVEHGQHADGDRAGQHAESAAPDHQRNGNHREQIDRRVVERVGKDRVFERDHVLAVDGFEVVEGALFAVEELHHRHAADVFLGKAVDARDGGAHAAIALAHRVAEEARDEPDQRQHREGQQRQPPVDAEHHDAHDGEREEVVHDGQNAAGEHFVDGVHVGGEARDQPAYGMRIEEADVQRCMWRKMSRRRSNMIFCPIHCIR